MKKQMALLLTIPISLWGFRMVRKLTENKDKSSDILARTIWGEARGEGVHGMQAVANVIMNRVKRGGWWGATIEDVCKKPAQFSCWNTSDPNYQKIKSITTDDTQFKQALNIARLAITGNLTDITGEATHYHSVAVKPAWADKLILTTRIGDHLFYA